MTDMNIITLRHKEYILVIDFLIQNTQHIDTTV